MLMPLSLLLQMHVYQLNLKKVQEHAKQERLDVTDIKKICVIESVMRSPNLILCMA